MHDETLELTSHWTGLLWACALASCRWPLRHPVAAEAGAALERHAALIARAGRVLVHAAGHGACCEEAVRSCVADLSEHGPWGDDEDEVRSLMEAAAMDPHGHFGDDRDRMHRALVGSLERLCTEVFKLRTHAWEKLPGRVERTPIGRMTHVGVIAGWIAGPSWRWATGPDAVRRALHRIVDGPPVMQRLDGNAPPAGLERCVVEVHYWLRTGELGQPWMSDWTQV